MNGLKLIKEDIREVDRNGNKAPSLGAAMSRGLCIWKAYRWPQAF